MQQCNPPCPPHLCEQWWHHGMCALRGPALPCERCGGSGRLTIYDTATYIGQPCSPIGDEPCPACSSEGERDEQ